MELIKYLGMKLVKEEYVVWGVIIGISIGVLVGVWTTRHKAIPYQPGDEYQQNDNQECESQWGGC